MQLPELVVCSNGSASGWVSGAVFGPGPAAEEWPRERTQSMAEGAILWKVDRQRAFLNKWAESSGEVELAGDPRAAEIPANDQR